MSTTAEKIDNLTSSEKSQIKKIASREGIKLTEARRKFLESNRGDYWLRQSIFGTYTPTAETIAKMRADNGYSFDTDIAERSLRIDLGYAPEYAVGDRESLARAFVGDDPEMIDGALRRIKKPEIHPEKGSPANFTDGWRLANRALSSSLSSLARDDVERYASYVPTALTLGGEASTFINFSGPAGSGKTALLSAIHLGVRARYSADQVEVIRITAANRRRTVPRSVQDDFRFNADTPQPQSALEQVNRIIRERSELDDVALNRLPVLVFLVDISQAAANFPSQSAVDRLPINLSQGWELGVRAIFTHRRGSGPDWRKCVSLSRQGQDINIPVRVSPGVLHESDSRRTLHTSETLKAVLPHKIREDPQGFTPHGAVPASSPLWNLVGD